MNEPNIQNKKHIISALVENRVGVLAKISGLFARRGYNIDSLSVCATEDPQFSRMTIVVVGDDVIIKQIRNQLAKLIPVTKVIGIESEKALRRELLLIKISMPAEKRPEIAETIKIYKAKSVDLTTDSMVVELTGEPHKINAFIDVIRPYGIIEMARTGLTAIHRGTETLKDQKD